MNSVAPPAILIGTARSGTGNISSIRAAPAARSTPDSRALRRSSSSLVALPDIRACQRTRLSSNTVTADGPGSPVRTRRTPTVSPSVSSTGATPAPSGVYRPQPVRAAEVRRPHGHRRRAADQVHGCGVTLLTPVATACG